MAYALSTPVTGSAQTGLTAPTYTIALDTAPTYNGKQYAVTALGGTQPGVSVNTPLAPFRLNLVRPATLKSAAPLRSNSNSLTANNRNKWVMIGHKGGLLIPASSVYGVMQMRCEIDIPSGLETAGAAEVRAFLSFFIGALTQASAGIGDTFVTGVL